MPTFISTFLNHTSEYESSTAFWKWSAYAAIKAVLRDNVYRKQGDSTLYPSQYILFLARSSYDRKNWPIVLCERLVNTVSNTKVISGRASVQGILDELSRVETNSSGKIVKGGSAIFFAPELSAAIVEDPAAVKILTDIYDYKPNPFKNILRTQPRFKIEKLIFSMLAASNADMIRDTYSLVAVQGGLLARTMLVFPNEIRPGNDLLDTPNKEAGFECLVKLLLEIGTLHGEFQITEDAKVEFRNWYIPFRDEYSRKPEKTGILGRIHTHILKLAMVLTANDMSLIITKKHIEEAMAECLILLPNYNTFMLNTTGKSNIKEAGEIVLEELYNAPQHTLTIRTLLSKHWSKFDLELLEKLGVTLEAGGLIFRLTQGNEISYQLTGKCLELLHGKQMGI